MQSTGQTSTQAVSLVPMQGSAMMYMPIGQLLLQKRGGFYPSASARRLGTPGFLRFPDADLVSEVLAVLLRVADRHFRSLRERSVESRFGSPDEPDLLAVARGHENRVIRGLELCDRSGDG